MSREETRDTTILHLPAELFNSVSVGLLILTEEWKVRAWNHRMQEFTGIEEERVVGRDLREFLPEFKKEKYQVLLNIVFTDGAPVILSPQLHRKLYVPAPIHPEAPLQERFFFTTIAPASLEGLSCAVFTVQDVTDLVKRIQLYKEMKDRALVEIERRKRVEEQLLAINKKLERSARTDPLTGLGNRREMEERLDAEIGRALRTGSPFSIIMADIDNFKTFNDTYGHDCGDYILVKLAQLFKQSLRRQDSISRWGGEEFLILLPDTRKEGALVVAEKLRNRVGETPFLFAGKEHNVTLTFGVSTFDETSHTVYEYIKRADQALLVGKASGKNCVRFL